VSHSIFLVTPAKAWVQLLLQVGAPRKAGFPPSRE